MTNIQTFKIQNIDFQIEMSMNGVFNPHPISLLLANSLIIKPTDFVLDIGTGSGIFAIVAARLGAKHVTATDIYQSCILSAQKNSRLNSVAEKITFLTGNFFEPLKQQKFDIIVSNPPCMPFPKGGFYINKGMSMSVNGGEDGSEKMIEFIDMARSYLKPGGDLFLPIAKWNNWKKTLNFLNTYFEAQIINSDFVQYYLAEYDPSFYKHIMRLKELGLVDIELRNKKPYAEIFIYKAKLKKNKANKEI